MATSVDDASTRSKLALYVCGAGVLGITAISIVLLAASDDKHRPEMARLVFASVLPLLGTWIGTILAFYFARENLQAASSTTLETLKLAGTFPEGAKVGDVMTPLGKIDPIRRVPDKAAAEALKLRDLYNAMQGSKNSRVPVLTEGAVALAVAHEPDVDKYAQLAGKKATDLGDDDTLGKLLENSTLRPAVETLVAVSETATVSDARAAMDRKPDCKDVFVTSNGELSGKVTGWLTNSDLARAR
jgi:CBS domain-containing protein